MNTALSSKSHMQMILTSLRKKIAIFKSSINVRKECLLLRVARTYIVPTLHNLEFVGTISHAQTQRFDFLLSKFFNKKTVGDFQKFRSNIPWLDLKKLHRDARKRYENDF